MIDKPTPRLMQRGVEFFYSEPVERPYGDLGRRFNDNDKQKSNRVSTVAFSGATGRTCKERSDGIASLSSVLMATLVDGSTIMINKKATE